MNWCWLWTHATHLKDLGQCLAWMAAAGFLAWKVWTGYMLINLSIELTTSRFPSPEEGKDYLLLRLALTKGDRAKLSLRKVVFRIKPTKGQSIEVSLGHKELSVGSNGRALRLTPGEATHFERWSIISAREPYLVIAELQGKAAIHGPWRATSVTLPNKYEHTEPALDCASGEKK